MKPPVPPASTHSALPCASPILFLFYVDGHLEGARPNHLVLGVVQRDVVDRDGRRTARQRLKVQGQQCTASGQGRASRLAGQADLRQSTIVLDVFDQQGLFAIGRPELAEGDVV